MKYESKTFGDLAVGEHFWSFGEDAGDKDMEKIKTYPGQAEWVDGEPDNTIFYPTDYEVWVAVYEGWPTYVIAIWALVLFMMAVAFVFSIMDYFKKTKGM